MTYMAYISTFYLHGLYHCHGVDLWRTVLF